MRTSLILGALLVLPDYARAEVMDKELSIPQIWESFVWALGFLVVASLLWRWLLVPSLLAGLLTGLGFAWTEWFDPFVGPAIRAEVGPTYGVHVQAALTILVTAHLFGWFVSSKRSLMARRDSSSSYRPSGRGTLVFATAMAGVVALGATSGFGASVSIWCSPPVVVAAGFLAWAAFRTVAQPSSNHPFQPTPQGGAADRRR